MPNILNAFIRDFLQVHGGEEILDQRLAEFALGEGIGDDETKLAARLQQTKAEIEERANQQIFARANTFPALAVELALLRVARSYKRRVAQDEVETASTTLEDIGKVNAPGEVEGAIEVGPFQFPELGVEADVERT